jgi:hypothetical protein
MTARNIAPVLALLILCAGASGLAQNSFESVDFPGLYIRHANSLGEITRITTPLDRADATFLLRPALSGPPGAVSFESVNYPGHFLRHQDFRIKLHKNDGSDLFNKDASFIPRAGLAGGISYESVNFPGRFLRHRDYHLWVEDNDGSDLFRKDASFYQRAPLQTQKIPCSMLEAIPEGFRPQVECE